MAGVPLKLYRFDDSPLGASFYFQDGAESATVYATEIETAEPSLSVQHEDEAVHSLSVDTDEGGTFKVYTRMLETCGVEIAS